MSQEQDLTTLSEDGGGSQKHRGDNIEITGEINYVAVGNNTNVTSAPLNLPGRSSFNASEKLKNPNELLEDLSKYRGPEKDEMEKQIFQNLLPYIESHAIKSASSCNDALELFARFCSLDLKSPKVTKQSLKMLKHLLYLEFGKCEYVNAHLIETERILRQAFVDGGFCKEVIHLQRCRMEVYNSILALVLLNIARGLLINPYNKKDKEEMIQVTKNISKSLQRASLPKKDRWRFSMETALNLIEGIVGCKRVSRIPKFLYHCKEKSRELEDKDREKVDARLEKLLRAEGGSVNLYVIMRMLHGQMCNDSNSFGIIEWIIKKHPVFCEQWQRKDEDWQFALLVCQILLHTINNKELPKGSRTRAARCLANLQLTKVYGKSDVIRSIIEKYFLKTFFALDLESRKIVLEERFKQELQEKISVYPILIIKQVCKTYELKGLEIIKTIFEDEDRLVFRGLYDYMSVAITIAKICPLANLYAAHDKDFTPSDIAFKNEAAILQRLNETSNEYVPMVYTVDTRNRPYHMICEYIPKEDLLHFLKVCKEEEPPTYHELLEICLGIAKCMIFVHGNNIIHNELRAEHVLLDDKHNVKLTGFKGGKIFSETEMKNGKIGENLGREDPSVRYAAPECFGDNPLFSPESDVWAFGILMYVAFTCGGTPYANMDIEHVPQQVLLGGILPKECMRDEVYSIIQMCLARERKERISFQKILELLQKLLASSVGQDNERLKVPLPIREEAYDGLPLEEPLLAKHEPRSTTTTKILVEFNQEHLEKIKSLDHPNLLRIIKSKKTKLGIKIIFENCGGQNLRDYISHNVCSDENLIRFSAQLAEVINYLHSNNIVLCNLNAEKVMVVNNWQIKIGLHWSKSVWPTYNEDNASACIIHGKAVDPDMYRWCAKEVIQDNIFSQPGDIWSLGMTILEMFLCRSEDDRDRKPFSRYTNEEIVSAIKNDVRPFQPEGCPDWVYVLMTQCWCLHTTERASSLSLLDCLTHTHPWESYILQRWVEKHEIHENWPNTNVFQRFDKTTSLSRQDVENSISEEFYGCHTYQYEIPFWYPKKMTVIRGVTGNHSPSLRNPPPQPSSLYTGLMPNVGEDNKMEDQEVGLYDDIPWFSDEVPRAESFQSYHDQRSDSYQGLTHHLQRGYMSLGNSSRETQENDEHYDDVLPENLNPGTADSAMTQEEKN